MKRGQRAMKVWRGEANPREHRRSLKGRIYPSRRGEKEKTLREYKFDDNYSEFLNQIACNFITRRDTSTDPLGDALTGYIVDKEEAATLWRHTKWRQLLKDSAAASVSWWTAPTNYLTCVGNGRRERWNFQCCCTALLSFKIIYQLYFCH